SHYTPLISSHYLHYALTFLHLSITSCLHKDTTASACNSYTWSVDGKTYTASGNYTSITTGSNGCSDTTVLHLSITSGLHKDTTASACNSYALSVEVKTYTAL